MTSQDLAYLGQNYIPVTGEAKVESDPVGASLTLLSMVGVAVAGIVAFIVVRKRRR